MRRREFIGGLIGGTVLASSRRAQAQTSRTVPVVGYLWHTATAEEEQPYFGAVIEGFTERGYVQGKNIDVEHRFPAEKPEIFRRMAAELVALKPDVLMGGAISTSYLKEATADIPIVFVFVPDPIGMKLVKSFAHPGGNVTGFVNFGRDLIGKRLQSLQELVPGLSHVALLVNSDQPSARIYTEETGSAAAELQIAMQIFDVKTKDALAPAFDAMERAGMQALITASGGSLFQWKEPIAKLALDHRLPYCAFSKETFEAGALLSYGADQVQMCRDSVGYVDKILKGAHPRDLPVQQPTKLQLLVNLKIAKTLGLKVSPTLLATADVVIE